MADTASCYQVSDHLKDRHPYTRERTATKQDKGEVFNGYGNSGIRNNIDALTNPEISVGGKEKALQNLLRSLSSAEAKSRLVGWGLLDGVRAMAKTTPETSPACRKLACQVVRQLAILPTSLIALYEEGCVPLVVEVLEQAGGGEDVNASRLAACEALRQISEPWDGRKLLLGVDLPKGFNRYESNGQEDEVEEEARKEERERLGRHVVATLTKVISDPKTTPSLLLSALRSLANMTTEEKGLQYALCENTLRDANQILEKYVAAGDDWVFATQGTQIVGSAVTVCWNITMDEFGKDKAIEVPLVPYTLGRLLHASLRYPDKHLDIKAGITGALSAIYVKAETKRTAVLPIYDTPQKDGEVEITIASLLVKALKQGNAIYTPLLKQKKEGTGPADPILFQNASNMLKNATQAVRLLAELPAGLKALRVLLKDEDVSLRRQIFYSTAYEEMMVGS